MKTIEYNDKRKDNYRFVVRNIWIFDRVRPCVRFAA